MKVQAKSGRSRGKKKRGRKMVEGVLREPNGRASRARKPRDSSPSLTALYARARRYGITFNQAMDPRSATWLGRLNMLGVKANGLNDDQYNAAVRFLEIRNDYLKSIEAEGACYDKIEYTGNTEAHTRFCIAAKEKYLAAVKRVAEAQNENRTEKFREALQYAIIEDMELPHLLGPTRLVLNILHHHFEGGNSHNRSGPDFIPAKESQVSQPAV